MEGKIRGASHPRTSRLPSGRNHATGPRAVVLLALLRHDGASRHAHGHRRGNSSDPDFAGPERKVLGGILHARRCCRSLLALRRRHLDLSLPATLSDRPSLREIAMTGHIDSVKTYVGVLVVLLILTGLTTGVA